MTTETNATPWYTWTSGPRGVFRTREDAFEAWARFERLCAARHGQSARTVTCGVARMYECRTRAMARTVRVSSVRPGERIVGHG